LCQPRFYQEQGEASLDLNMPGKNQQVNRETPIPLYFQIGRILHQEINEGKYQPGDYIPTEMELQKRFGVSRATIRQAIADLVSEGLLERRRSKGTTVSSTRIEARLSDLASFTNEIVNSGLTLKTRIMDFKHIPVPATVAEVLDLRPGEMVAAMERLRIVDDKPVAHERWYAPEKYFPGLDSNLFGETGLQQSTYYVLMKHYGIEINRAVDTISPLAVEGRDARFLKVENGTPVLLRTRISYASNDHPVTYGSGMYLIRLKFVQETGH
jgi:GntR family transcriptional regulator